MSDVVVSKQLDQASERTNQKIERLRAVIEAKPKKKPPKKFYNVGVKRDGNEIVVPEGMTNKQAVEWLIRKDKEENQVQSFRYRLKCSPLDGFVAIKKAADETFGYTAAKGEESPGMGEDPPRMIKVPTGVNTTEDVPVDKMQPPALEGGFIQAEVEQSTSGVFLAVNGQCKKKHKHLIDNFIDIVKDILKFGSIYRGKAIKIEKLSEIIRDFEAGAPEFMDLNIEDENLILNELTMRQLETSVNLRVERTEECLANNVPLKHGCLLMGPYGTGKTLSAKFIAKKCEENGWTFIYLSDSRELPEAIRFAKMYAPAVLFSEDIDKAVSGDRNSRMDEIFNTLDGVDTKDLPIITVLTTNHPEKIHAGFLRAGRIDTVIPVNYPDHDTIKRFIDYYSLNADGRSGMAPDQDLEEAANALEGFPPAFIAEVVNKAKMFTFHRVGEFGNMTSDDIVAAASNLKAHKELMEENHEDEEPTNAERLETAFTNIFKNEFGASIKDTEVMMIDVHDWVGNM